MKKFKSLLITCCLIMIVALVGCGKANKPNMGVKFNSDKDMFAFASISSANVLGGANMKKLSAESADLSSEPVKPDMAKVNEYVKLMENLLMDNGPVLVESTTSDKPEYETKLVYKVKDLAGSAETYEIYYNQVLLSEEEEKEEPKEENKEEEEFEQEYSLTGIAIIEGVTYEVEGKKELEVDELELSITIKLDEKNQVILEEETEKDETEYVYKVIKDGKDFLELEFEIDLVDGETEIEFNTVENGQNVTYKFEKEEKKGKIEFKIEHKVNKTKTVITAKGSTNEETGEITYVYYVNGEEIQFIN